MAEPTKSSGAEPKKAREPTGDIEIGARLCAARKRANMSGEALGGHVGVTKSAVSQWESGAVAIDNKHIPLISILLDIPISDLATLPPGAEWLTSRERLMLDIFRRVSEERRESLLVLLKGL